MNRKVLHLTVNKRWFDMIASGEKKEEYREIKPYWVKRFVDMCKAPTESHKDISGFAANICFDINNGHDWESVVLAYYCKVEYFDAVLLRNGYSASAPQLLVACNGIDVGSARPEWSDNWSGDVFRIHLGKIIEAKNLIAAK